MRKTIKDGRTFTGFDMNIRTAKFVALVQDEDSVRPYAIDGIEAVAELKRYLESWEKIIGLFRRVM